MSITVPSMRPLAPANPPLRLPSRSAIAITIHQHGFGAEPQEIYEYLQTDRNTSAVTVAHVVRWITDWNLPPRTHTICEKYKATILVLYPHQGVDRVARIINCTAEAINYKLEEWRYLEEELRLLEKLELELKGLSDPSLREQVPAVQRAWDNLCEHVIFAATEEGWLQDKLPEFYKSAEEQRRVIQSIKPQSNFHACLKQILELVCSQVSLFTSLPLKSSLAENVRLIQDTCPKLISYIREGRNENSNKDRELISKSSYP